MDKSPDGDLSESYSQMMFATNGDRKAALKASAETLRIMRDEGATVEDLEASKLFGLKQDDLVFNLDTLNAVTSMAEAMGVSIREVNFDRDDALAAANFMRKTIDITANAEDRKNAWNKLPEEVAHWWYKLLSKDSELKQALWEAAKKSEKYKELVEKNYGDYSRFENSDDLFIEEAIGQLIAEAIHKKQEASKEVESFFDKFWNKVKEFRRRLRLVARYKRTLSGSQGQKLAGIQSQFLWSLARGKKHADAFGAFDFCRRCDKHF